MIDDWMGTEWPDEVVAAMRLFVQGDLIENPPMTYWAKPEFGLTILAQSDLGDGAPNEDLDLIDIDTEDRPPYGLITTETCDIVEEGERPKQPFILVAPVFDFSNRVDGTRLELLKSGRLGYQRYLGTHGLPEGVWAVDLRIEVPLEKSCLVGRTPIRPSEADSDRLTMAQFLAARRDRPVLDPRLHVGVVRPLRRWVEQMRPAKQVIAIGGVSVRMAISGSRTDPDGAAIIFIGEDERPSDECEQLWEQRWPAMKERASDQGIALLAHRFTSMRDISARDYVESVAIDLTFS